MKILKVFPDNPNDKHIAVAVDAMLKGNIIIYPTDTLYAFGCDALNNHAIEKICTLKSMKADKTSLSIICEDIAQAAEYARIDNNTYKLMRANLPGAFTFILPALSSLPKAFKGRRNVGIRIPNNNIALALVKELGHPIMTTSIPMCDVDNCTEPELMAQKYNNRVDTIIDCGRGDIIPSTIIDCTEEEPIITREGKSILNI
ncbi:MAG: L-threonylcarbamoyladenylate synthase [Muribaculaceae bacterium]|nr:L-threonylcarbamoyladenylate synthase [Muribaculaceae bacterium]